MKLLTLFAFLVFTTSLFAQTSSVKGIVKNRFSNEPIPFASVAIQGTRLGAVSDDNGNFEITGVEPGFIKLQVSSVGFSPFMSEQVRVTTSTHAYVEVPLEESSTTLNEVTVKVDKFSQKLETPLSLHRIGVEEIEKSAGSNRDISKVIQSLPGVGGSVSYRNDLIVRGGGPSENRFYLDGIEMPTLNHFSTQGASGGPVGILNVDFIKSADYYSSAFPSGKGNALSSVFDFKMIDGNKDKPTFRASVGASEVSFSANTPVGNNSSLLFSVRRSYLQFLFAQIGLPFLPTYNDITTRFKTKINDRNELTFLFIGAYDQFKLNLNADSTEQNRYILGYLPVNNQWNYTVGVTHKLYLGSSILTTVVSRNHLNNTIYKYLNNDESSQSNLLTNYKSNEIENKFRTEFSSNAADYNIIAGVSGEYAWYDNSTYNNLYINGAPTEFRYQSELRIVKYGAFGSVSKTILNDKLTLTGGLRVDGNNYSSKMSNPLKQLSPRLSGSYKLIDALSLNFNVGRYYQLPAYTMLGYRNEVGDLLNKQNSITYITNNHYVTGIELRPNSNSKITAEVFYKQYYNYPFSVKDSVSMASKGGDYGVFGDEQVTSTSKGQAKGFELLYRLSTASKLRISMAYTFVRSSFSDVHGSYIPSSWDSKHLFTATLGKSFKNNWDIGVKWRFVGGLPYTPYDFDKSSFKQAWDVNGRAYLNYGQYNTKRLASFNQLDIRVDKSFYYKKFMIGVYVDIQNATNQKAEQPAELVKVVDATGKPIILNPTAPIEQQKYALKELEFTSGNLLPTLGIIVEF